jgi:hypothetical protein
MNRRARRSRTVVGHDPFSATDRRLFTLVGRSDRDVVCAQILWLWAPPPGSRGPRRVLRTRRRTLTVGESLCVRWAALTCSPLPCAIDSRRAMACGWLVPDGAGRERRRDDRHHRPARRCRYRCLARLAARLLPRGAPAGPRRRPAGYRDHQAHQPAPASSWRAAFFYDGASSPAPRGSSPAAMPARPAAPWPSGTAKQSPHPC